MLREKRVSKWACQGLAENCGLIQRELPRRHVNAPVEVPCPVIECEKAPRERVSSSFFAYAWFFP